VLVLMLVLVVVVVLVVGFFNGTSEIPATCFIRSLRLLADDDEDDDEHE
jgi:hypothetical protein